MAFLFHGFYFFSMVYFSLIVISICFFLFLRILLFNLTSLRILRVSYFESLKCSINFHSLKKKKDHIMLITICRPISITGDICFCISLNDFLSRLTYLSIKFFYHGFLFVTIVFITYIYATIKLFIY